MTKEKKPSRMPVSEKRRSAALASAVGAGILGAGPTITPSPAASSASHALRSATAPRTSSPSSARDRDPDTTSGIIAPPPRAQLGASNASEDEAAGILMDRENTTTATPSAAAATPSGGGTPPSAAATAALLRDKDQRIADLERELGHSSTEFARLLDSLSQKESDSATFWQDKHEYTAANLARAEGEVRLLRAEVDVRDAEKAELTSVFEALAGRLSEREREAAELRAQVRGLKEFVSTSTRTDGQTVTSDEVFGEGMARLGNVLQNWVIVHFRKAKLDIQNAPEPVRQELEELAPTYQELSKVHLLQALVSRILVDMIFDAYFVGLSFEQAHQFCEMEATLSTLGSEQSVNQWRSTTLTLLRREVEPKWQAETDEAAASVIGRINRILDAITDSQGSEARDNGLRAPVLGAIDLARLLRVQKAVFAVHMPAVLPHQKTLFDPSSMEDVGGEEDEDELAQREISCVTFPGIIKKGDESGGQLHYRNVISKARVLCSPE